MRLARFADAAGPAIVFLVFHRRFYRSLCELSRRNIGKLKKLELERYFFCSAVNNNINSNIFLCLLFTFLLQGEIEY